MENRTVVNIVFNAIDEENEIAECSIQLPAFHVIPRVGERFIYYTVRDREGNYLNKSITDNNGIKIIDGIVEKVIYEIDQRGYKSKDKIVLGYIDFITIFVRGEPINNEKYDPRIGE